MNNLLNREPIDLLLMRHVIMMILINLYLIINNNKINLIMYKIKLLILIN